MFSYSLFLPAGYLAGISDVNASETEQTVDAFREMSDGI